MGLIFKGGGSGAGGGGAGGVAGSTFKGTGRDVLTAQKLKQKSTSSSLAPHDLAERSSCWPLSFNLRMLKENPGDASQTREREVGVQGTGVHLEV